MARYKGLKLEAFQTKKPCPICKTQMYHQGFETKAAFYERIGVKKGSPNSVKLRHQRKASADHILPKSRGGKVVNNILIMCQRCNSTKGDRTLEEWLG